MRISEFKPDFDDVLIRPKRSDARSRENVRLERCFKSIFKYRHIFPIINANMDTVGSFKMAETMVNLKAMGSVHKHYDLDKLQKFYGNAYMEKGQEARSHVFYTMGIKPEDFAKTGTLIQYCRDRNCSMEAICLDVANGYTKAFEDAVKRARQEFGSVTIMAGNVATPEVTESLILAGADIVKIGIGPGSVCTTRVKTGVGYPQLSAIAECADAAHGLKRYICADGGCRTPGDICKAFCAGADIVMLGGMLAGCDECEGEWNYNVQQYSWSLALKEGDILDGMNIEKGTYLANTITHDKNKDGQIIEKKKASLKYYGMSSKDAADKYHGGIASHRTDEGKAVYVPYKGPVVNTIDDIKGGLRSCGTYIGASELKDFPKCASFVRTGVQENKVFNELHV